MGEISAAIMLLLACVMVGSAIMGWKQITNAAWIFNIILIPVLSTMIMSGGASWIAILPVLGGFFINTGVSRCSGSGMTLTISIGQVFWIFAALMMGSFPSLLANTLNLVALIVREFSRYRNGAPVTEIRPEQELRAQN